MRSRVCVFHLLKYTAKLPFTVFSLFLFFKLMRKVEKCACGFGEEVCAILNNYTELFGFCLEFLYCNMT